ncbi:hypothetical protein FNV43_RR16503 [Rhamnella rubrinervis]|uniref:Uncharacterized protein n=1 Tax=Rhamnella rubrinervis TaxID=2594499 RepID=A0A8K0GYW3_9ROSA|nr:hypothetical protein FNV43_RR16503 [Rhamnella rubrinervis]
MELVNMSKAFLITFMLFFVVSMVSAQDNAPAPAPMDAGSAYSLPASGAVVGVSLVLSLLALFKH